MLKAECCVIVKSVAAGCRCENDLHSFNLAPTTVTSLALGEVHLIEWASARVEKSQTN